MNLYKFIQHKEKMCSYFNIWLYKNALYKCGNGVSFDGDITIHNPKGVIIEDKCIIKKGAIINSRVDEKEYGIWLGENVKIHEYAYLDDYGGRIQIGSNTGIGQFCVIGGQGGLKIGRDCMIAGHTYIVSANHKFDNISIPFREQGEEKKGIIIGNNVWIGAGCIILDGVTIGDNSVIGAGTVVTKSVISGTLNVGVPSKAIRKIGNSTSLNLLAN